MLKRCCVFLLLLLRLSAYSQEEFVTPSKLITRFPFIQLTGGIILLQARFDTHPDTLNFILDTGSGGISLDSLTTEFFRIAPEPSSRTIRGIAGIRLVSFINNRKLHLPGLTIDSLNFHVNNYSLLTSVYGEKIDGIIGYSVFSRYIIKLNYDSLHVEFWTKGAMKYPRGGYLFRPQITSLPVQSARIRDERQISARFLYDLGAGLNLMLTTDFIKDSAILHRKRKLYTKQAEGLGGKIDMHLTVIKEFKMGPYRFRNVPTYVFDDVYNITSYPYLGGIIGNDLLRRFNAIINYDKRDFYLVPNSHFSEPFDYAYSGIELYFIDGEILIGDVAKDSPAEKCGLLEGDVVVAVNKSFSQNLNQYKIALQTTQQAARIIVRRNGELKEFNFKVKHILH
ncbi:MAG TPA: aspartyl protease family protein [Flavisolibacter sp.]|nr:aspartyl protease family protein [Flavisolibacter sp.]